MLRTLFMGTPDFALPAFEVTAEATQLIAVVTQPDRPQGRGLSVVAPPVKVAALRCNIPVLQPDRIRNDPAFLVTLRQMAPDLIVVVAFGQILPQAVLDIPRFGCVNVHASLLPRYRGAAPIQWAIIRGETQTGVTTMQMDAGMDTGPILLQSPTEIGPEETADQLAARLSLLGASLLAKTLLRWETGRRDAMRQATDRNICAALEDGVLSATPQNNAEATLAPPLVKEDGEIRWTDSATAIFNRWRGCVSWPGTTTFCDGVRWKVPILSVGDTTGIYGAPGEVLRLGNDGLEVATGAGYIIIRSIQPDGKRAMTVREYTAGHTVLPGTQLGRSV